MFRGEMLRLQRWLWVPEGLGWKQKEQIPGMAR